MKTQILYLMCVLIVILSLHAQAKVIYIDDDVDLIWEQSYGGSSDDYSTELLLTQDGNIVVAGTTSSFGMGNKDVYLLKTDTNGLMLWDNTFGTSQYEYANSLTKTSDNSFVIAGWESHEPWINDASILMVKADSEGNEVWTKQFDYDSGIYAMSVIEAFDLNYIAVGSCYKSNDSKAGLLKSDTSGNKVWLKVYDSQYSYSEIVNHIEKIPQGGYITCGSESNNTNRGFLLKTNADNELIWRQIYFNDSHYLVFYCLQINSVGNYIVCGYTHWNYHYDGYVAEIDPNGNMLWSREYDLNGKDEYFTSIVETSNGNYVISGYQKQPDKAFILKINSFGNIVWKKILQNASNLEDIVKIDDRTFAVTGNTNYFGAGGQDIYLAKVQEPVIYGPLIHSESNDLLFTASFDNDEPMIQNFEIYNQGNGTLNWQIVEDCSWLDVNPSSGNSVGDTDQIQITVDKTGMDIGTYNYDIQVIDNNASNSPYLIKVRLVVHGYTVSVPDEFDTIQQAIDAASDGETVIVGPGTYQGTGNYNIDFKGKAITVRSADPNDPNIVDLTVIDGSTTIGDNDGFIFQTDEEPNSKLIGFTIKNFANGSGVAVSSAQPYISKCKISGNNAGIFYGGYHQPSGSLETLIDNCNISNNERGITIGDSNMRIANCSISNNMGPGIYGGSRATGDLIIDKCTISNNGNIGIDLSSNYNSVQINDCTITGNRGDNGGGICSGVNLTIENSIISGNYSIYDGGAIVFYEPIIIKNCTITDNFTESNYTITCNSYTGAQIYNSIIRNNYPDSTIRFRGSNENYIGYCNIEDGINSIELDEDASFHWQSGNIDIDPLFVNHGYWADANDPNIVIEPNNSNTVWVEGDYHLKSQAGRWDTNSQSWIQDDVTSPCIDAGDPNSPIRLEPFPNGGYVNMGAYGGTNQASKSYFGKPLCETIVAGDINGDCKVDELDLYILMLHWLEDNNP